MFALCGVAARLRKKVSEFKHENKQWTISERISA